MRGAILAVLILSACGGPVEDGRLVSTLYTGTCDWSGSEWLGVERMEVTLEYAPGSLVDRSLPPGATNCSDDTALFPVEGRVAAGSEIPKLEGAPSWIANGEDGQLGEAEVGFWTDELVPAGGCLRPDQVVSDGVTLVDAGVLDGATTPGLGGPGLVYLDGQREDEWNKPLQRGNPIEVSWTMDGWDESFVQIRQLNGGTLRQAVTCNTTGLSTFHVNRAVWDEVDDIGAEAIEIYVGFRNADTASSKGGDVSTLTQMVHVIRPE